MTDAPFNPEEYRSNARITAGDRSEMEQALVEHVYGQRVTKINMVRALDPVASKKYKRIVEYVEVQVYLDNNIVHLTRIIVPLGSIIKRGDGLADVDPTDPNYYFKPQEKNE